MASALAKDVTSVAVTPNSALCRNLVEHERRDHADARADGAEPQPAREKSGDDGGRGAPSAMRMPISCVLCLTVYDTSP